MRMIVGLAAFISALAIVLVGCSGSGGAPQAATSRPAQKILNLEQVLVMAKDNHFQPSTIQVERGTSLHFVIKNLDFEDHDYTVVPVGAPPC